MSRPPRNAYYGYAYCGSTHCGYAYYRHPYCGNAYHHYPYYGYPYYGYAYFGYTYYGMPRVSTSSLMRSTPAIFIPLNIEPASICTGRVTVMYVTVV